MKLNYKITGTPNSPVLILSNSLGSTYRMWDDLIPFLTPYFRVLQYDTRGHGLSDIPKGAYEISQLGQDVVNLMDDLAIEKAYYCGVSMGGLTGQWLAVNASDRFHKICISNTAAKIGDQARWDERVTAIQKDGFGPLMEMTMKIWFSPAFGQDSTERLRMFEAMFLENHVEGYGNCCFAIGGADFRSDLSKIKLPILVLTGDEDPVTNVKEAEYLQKHIPGSKLVVLPGRHLVNAEAPQLYAETLIDFFIGSDTYDKGMHVRKTVLGTEHVTRAEQNRNSFNEDFQDLVNEVPWGRIWTRPGLDKHQRSLITLATMIALNRKEEFKMHIKAAFNNGVTKEELKEVILQSAIYCGFPAALDGFRAAQEVFEAEGL